MLNISICMAAASVLLLASSHLQADAPPGWILAGTNPENYETGLDSKVAIGGQPSAYLRWQLPVYQRTHDLPRALPYRRLNHAGLVYLRQSDPLPVRPGS